MGFGEKAGVVGAIGFILVWVVSAIAACALPIALVWAIVRIVLRYT